MQIVLDGRTIQDHFPGIGRYAFNLAAALPAALPGAQVTLLHNPRQRNSRFRVDTLAAHGIRVVPCAAANFSLAEQWRVPRTLARLAASLYHSPYYLMPYAPGPPAVVTIHDLIPLLRPESFSARTRLVFRVAVRLAVSAARRIITDSQSAADDLTRQLGVAAQKIAVVPIAADPEFSPQPPGAVEALRSRLGLPEAYVLYFGSNKPHKNLPRLVRAYLSLPASVPPLLIGGHWEDTYSEARTLAEAGGALAAGRIGFIGPVAGRDLPALYTGASLFVFPSLYEGFGLPPLEAMACGVPVAVSRASSLLEVVGEAGWLFDPSDDRDMARVLGEAMSSPRQLAEVGARGRERASRFSWHDTARRTAKVYAEALSAAR